MAMSLKEMLNQAISEVGFRQYREYFSSTQPAAQQILALAQREINDLSKFRWQALTRTYELPMTSDTSYALPEDYRQFVPDTAFSQTRQGQLPTDPTTWSYYKSRNVGTGVVPRMRIIEGRLEIDNPDPGQTLRIEYISNAPVIDTDEVRRARFQKDSDQIVLNEDLFMLGIVWRFLRAKGMGWEPALGEYNTMKRREQGTDKGARTVSIAGVSIDDVPIPEPQADLLRP